jgi:NAD+ synthase (glutamine-hydrolysing)
MEEIAFGPALWLWDYLRRSGARGFFLPLSGGSDSAAVASIVASMAKHVFLSILNGNGEALSTLRRIVKIKDFTPTKYQDIVNQVFVTSYLGTKNSSKETLDRANRIAEGIGAHHF